MHTFPVPIPKLLPESASRRPLHKNFKLRNRLNFDVRLETNLIEKESKGEGIREAIIYCSQSRYHDTPTSQKGKSEGKFWLSKINQLDRIFK